MMEKFFFTCSSDRGFFDFDNNLIQVGNETIYLTKRFKEPLRRLYLIFSKKCNLRCVYCFQKENKKRSCIFSSDEIKSVITKSIHNFDELVLFGGEPLLDANLDTIKEILSCRISLPLYIFTNGNISSKAQELIISNKDQFHCIAVTIDGTKNIHDSLRINPTGSSFDNAFSTIEFLAKEGVAVQIQVNVDRRNIQDICDLIMYLEEKKIFQIHFMLNPIKYSQYTLRQEELIQLYVDLRKKHPNLDIRVNSRLVRNLFALLQDEPLEAERCGLSQTVVADFSSGMLYACPHNEKSRIGNISDKMIYEHRVISDLLTRTLYKGEECLSCEYTHLCAYGCPFENGDFSTCKNSMDLSLKVIFDNFDVLFDVE